MMQPHLSSNTAVPITSTAGILNLDHYKYLRSLLPTVPHFIESLSFTDLNNWECQIYVNLLTESDCLKWLGDFEDKTNTCWKADPESGRSLVKGKGCIWQMVYTCVPSESKKECSGKLEMKIVGQDEAERNSRSGKQYPCQVSINFYHNHNATNSNVFNMETFKSQDIPSHLKEGFEGYFQETMQPVSSSVTTTVNLNAIKPQHTLLNSPLTHTLANNQQVVIKADLPLSPVGQHLDGKLLNRQTQPEVVNLGEMSSKLDNMLEVLKRMLKQPGTGASSVKQFVDKFEKLESDQNQLEDALTSFGGQWDWLVSADSSQGQTSALPQIITTHQPQTPDMTSPKKVKKKKLDDKDLSSISSPVFSTNIVNGQIILQQQQPSTQTSVETPSAPDSKKRKRARCGNCSGCLNRDKTQDCRQCRNCLDQKRYGGPGRLKKACIKRQCVVISQIGSSDLGGETKSGTVAVKSEPVYSIKSEPVSLTTSSVPVSVSQTVAGPVTPAPTILSWPPATPYAPGQTFQVQVQQPVQFAFQPTTFATGAGGTQIQYSAVQPGQIQQLTATQLVAL